MPALLTLMPFASNTVKSIKIHDVSGLEKSIDILACPTGFKLFDGQSCIKIVTDTPASHDDAKTACTTANANAFLLEPRSMSRQQKLAQLVKQDSTMESSGVHIGMTKDDAAGWIWESDGTTVFATGTLVLNPS